MAAQTRAEAERLSLNQLAIHGELIHTTRSSRAILKTRWKFFATFMSLVQISCVTVAHIPLTSDERDAFLYLEASYNGRQGIYLLDTGTALPVVTEQAAYGQTHGGADAILTASICGSVIREGEICRSSEGVAITRPNLFEIGAVKMSPGGLFQIRDLSQLSDLVGMEIDGIVGSGILNGGRYTIDFRSRELRLEQSDDASSLVHTIEFDKQSPMVKVKVNGLDVLFLIDSGALQSSISKDSADKLLSKSAITDGAVYTVLSVDGAREERRSRAFIESFQFADVSINPAHIFVSDSNVIGLDILSKGVLTVDARIKKFNFVME